MRGQDARTMREGVRRDGEATSERETAVQWCELAWEAKILREWVINVRLDRIWLVMAR